MENLTITEDIYLNNSCNPDNAERVLLHEFIHVVLFHFLDEAKLQSLFLKMMNIKIDLTDYLKKELISSNYDNPSKLIVPSENWFSSLFEDWDSQDWLYTVDPLMKNRWRK